MFRRSDVNKANIKYSQNKQNAILYFQKDCHSKYHISVVFIAQRKPDRVTMGSRDILEVDYSKSSQLTHVEAQVLSQYQLLATQLHSLSDEIQQLNSTSGSGGVTLRSEPQGKLGGKHQSANDLLDNLRNLEMQISLIYTLFKGAVYSLFLDNEQDNVDMSSDGSHSGANDRDSVEEDEKEELNSYENLKSPSG